MMVAACSPDKRLIPFRPEPADISPANFLPALRKRYSDAKLIPIPDPVSVSTEDIRCCFSMGLEPESVDVPVLEYITCQGIYGTPVRVPEARGWIDSLFADLKPRRFAHSLAVADTARRIAARFGEDPLKAEKAGLLHDCAKSISLSEMQKIARENSLETDEAFLASSALLHSEVGAWIAEHRYGVTDPDILEAIRFHNTGHAGMSRLAVCVALADSIEPTRDPYPFLDEARSLASHSLEKAFLLSLERTSEYVMSKGAYLHPRTLDTIAWLRAELN